MARWYVANYKDHDATLECKKDGQFSSFQLWAYPVEGAEQAIYSTARSINLIAAGLHAYTGWPTKRVIDLRSKLIDEAWREMQRSKVRGDVAAHSAEVDLPNHGTASLSGGDGLTLIIEVSD